MRILLVCITLVVRKLLQFHQLRFGIVELLFQCLPLAFAVLPCRRFRLLDLRFLLLLLRQLHRLLANGIFALLLVGLLLLLVLPFIRQFVRLMLIGGLHRLPLELAVRLRLFPLEILLHRHQIDLPTVGATLRLPLLLHKRSRHLIHYVDRHVCLLI